jgi:hypothetical protein
MCGAELPLPPGSASLAGPSNHGPDQECTERLSRRGRAALWDEARHISSCFTSISTKQARPEYCVPNLGRRSSLTISGCAFVLCSLNLLCSRFRPSHPDYSWALYLVTPPILLGVREHHPGGIVPPRGGATIRDRSRHLRMRLAFAIVKGISDGVGATRYDLGIREWA